MTILPTAIVGTLQVPEDQLDLDARWDDQAPHLRPGDDPDDPDHPGAPSSLTGAYFSTWRATFRPRGAEMSTPEGVCGRHGGPPGRLLTHPRRPSWSLPARGTQVLSAVIGLQIGLALAETLTVAAAVHGRQLLPAVLVRADGSGVRSLGLMAWSPTSLLLFSLGV